MNQLLDRLLRLASLLYPRAWRDRYGDEFQALLDDTHPPRWRDLLDLTNGALLMQLENWKRPVIAVLAGVAIAIALPFFRPADFASTASIRIEEPSVVPYLSMQALSFYYLKQILSRNELYPDEQTRQPLEDTLGQMRSNIKIETTGQEVRLRFQYPDAEKSRQVANQLAAVYSNELLRYNGVRDPLTIAATLSSTPIRSFRFAPPIGILLVLGLMAQLPFRRTLALAGYGLVGFAVVLAPMYLIGDRFQSHATVSALEPLELPPHIESHETEMPAGVPRVYRLATVANGQRQAQSVLAEGMRAVKIREVIEAPTYPQTPVSPNRLTPSFCGALAALMLGLFRTRAGSTSHRQGS